MSYAAEAYGPSTGAPSDGSGPRVVHFISQGVWVNCWGCWDGRLSTKLPKVACSAWPEQRALSALSGAAPIGEGCASWGCLVFLAYFYCVLLAAFPSQPHAVVLHASFHMRLPGTLSYGHSYG